MDWAVFLQPRAHTGHIWEKIKTLQWWFIHIQHNLMQCIEWCKYYYLWMSDEHETKIKSVIQYRKVDFSMTSLYGYSQYYVTAWTWPVTSNLTSSCTYHKGYFCQLSASYYFQLLKQAEVIRRQVLKTRKRIHQVHAAALLVGHQTCDSVVAGSSPDKAQPHSSLGQPTYTCVPLKPSSIIWYRPRGSDALGWEGNHGPGEK